MLEYLVLYLAFGFIGWFIDSIYRTIEIGKWTTGTHLKYFSQIYAIGGVLIISIYQFINITPTYQVLLAALSVTFLEYFSGIFCVKVMKKRYWDYSSNKFNLHGHTDLLHFVYWIIASGIIRLIFNYLPI